MAHIFGYCCSILLSLHMFAQAKVMTEMKDFGSPEAKDAPVTWKDSDMNAEGKIERYNREHNISLFQGDIITDRDRELQELLHPRNRRVKRNALRWKKRLWTSRTIPYIVPSFMDHVRLNLQRAIDEIHKYTCIRFVPYQYKVHENYVYITNNDGCSSRVGKKYFESGQQTLSLGDGCNFVSTILHELLHTIGFFHEQSRNDRDQHVKILWQNILDGFENQFDKYDWQDINHLGKDYDFQSVMHYDRKAFTKNGRPTIEAIHDPNLEFRTSSGLLSTRDIIEIDALYDCKATTSYGWASWSAYTPCDKDCFKYRERYCYNSGNVQSCGDSSQDIYNVYGVQRQQVKCDSSECPAPIDGNWGRWASWGACSVTCNEGTKTRTRQCNKPAPKHGGADCPGSDTEEDFCVMKRCHLDYDDTDFEAGMGMWRNKAHSVLRWARHAGLTNTANTGPSKDHTTGTGYYLYMESSAPARANDVASLESSAWLNSKSQGQCLKFYYHMYGKTMGTLSVKIRWEGGQSYLLFLKTGNQGSNWILGTGNIDPPNAGLKYQLTFEGKVGDAQYSDIALDNVYIDDGLCACQDQYVNCGQWAADGDCSKEHIKQSCKKSCKVCTACMDSQPSCATWASQGQCEKNPQYMLINCQKSCHSCECKGDSEASCPTWASQGWCEKNPSYMSVYCSLSCETCVCKDTDINQCPIWAASGECKKNPLFMMNACQKSCNACNCKDSDPTQCPAWAANGQCQSNPAYMEVNCKKSCGTC